MFIQKERAHAKNLYEQSKEQKEYIQRKSLCQLIYKKLEDIPFITEKQYDAVIEKYPLLGNLYALVKKFYRIVFSQKPDDLNCWFDTASSYEILEIQSFLEGMRSDLTAVKNRILLKYTNGLAEGSVNKIKLLNESYTDGIVLNFSKQKYCFMRNFTVKLTNFGNNQSIEYDFLWGVSN